MSAPFPHRYEVAVTGSPRHASKIDAPPRPEITGGAPPEFDGHDNWWSPEHLLLSSAALCFVLTFEEAARRAQFPYARLHCHASGTLDRTAEGPRFVAVALKASLEAPGAAPQTARSLLEAAKAHCLITNSLKAAVTLEIVAASRSSAG